MVGKMLGSGSSSLEVFEVFAIIVDRCQDRVGLVAFARKEERTKRS